MRQITKSELRELAAHGEGVVLVDRHRDGDDRPSTLHRVTCVWPRRASVRTPLLYETSFGAAFKWLSTHRGAEGDGWKRCRDCRASSRRSIPGGPPKSGDTEESPDFEEPIRTVGQPVWTTDRGDDISWVTAVSPELRVAAFDSPGRLAFAERPVETLATSPFLPRIGDRCYVERDGAWMPAVCNDDAVDVDQFVSVVCDEAEDDLPLTALRFRRIAPIAEPLLELAGNRAGLVGRYRARATFLERYWHLAEPSRGLLGVSSAAVDLHPHQIGVARRILADPVQRYLLADEVGLGKTIEAGFVIRQRLIDAPRSVVRVVVPNALVWQWESELESKFALSQFGGVELFGFDDAHAFDPIQTPDLLVIDEAHRIAAGWNSPAKELAERFEAARSVAHRVPRILLLSATPVLHRERDLFAMLHLLDPDTYRLEDVDTFKARITDRERIGELLLALRPGAPTFLLRSRLPDLREAFPRDARMAELVDRLASLIEGDPSERETALADARSHISETYRLHRRLLRNRRSAIEGSGYSVRGRLGMEIMGGGDPRSTAVDAWLERWRLTLLEDAYELGHHDAVADAARAFLIYAGCASGDLSVMRDLVQFKLTWKRAFREASGLPADEAASVRAFGITDRQRAALAELLEILGDQDSDTEARATGFARPIAGLDEEAILVFVSSEAIAQALRDHIAADGIEVQTYTASCSDTQRRLVATTFSEGTGRRLLICDRTGEEGINLQAADCIVHVDLPLNTTRIEQRIGRVDRHGERRPVRSYVPHPGPAGGFAAWWLEALANSFEVFDRTTAPVQYAIETVQTDLFRTLALGGVEDAAVALESVKTRVQEEQARIDKLDSLDALARQDTDDLQFVERVRVIEAAAADEFSEAVLDALRRSSQDLDAEIETLSAGSHTISVSANSPALRIFRGLSGRAVPFAANRSLAVTAPAVSLLRPGAPLVEALRLHLGWDDRCQTAAAWVHDSRVDEPTLAVRCDVVAKADPAPAFIAWKRLEAARPRSARATRTDADAPLAIAALHRRLDAYLAPQPATLWMDRYGSTIDDPDSITALNGYIKLAEDQSWTADHWAQAAAQLGVLALDDVLEPLGPLVRAVVLADPALRDSARIALGRARSDWQDAERALRLRADLNLDASVASRDLADERDVAERLLQALESPIVEWAGAALVFLTPTGPFE